MPLTALALNCTLKPSPADSSCELLRMADYNIKPGGSSADGWRAQLPARRSAWGEKSRGDIS